MDEPELPLLSQPALQSLQARVRPSFLLTRKRTLDDYDNGPNTSSDPATFSSDEAAPGAENYASGKRKKHTFRGSWWDRHPAKNGSRSSQRKKREFTRNFDSGIFMGSESEEPLSSDSFTIEDELVKDQENANDHSLHGRTPEPRSIASLETTPRARVAPRDTARLSKEHEGVCHIVKQCLEKAKEDVDLSHMSLSTLPSEVISLNTLSKQDEIVPGMLHIGTDLEPQLRLYLGNNLFTKIPSLVFDLRNLRMLSLRNSCLTSISPAIRELSNLECLNIAGNQLAELPGEVLDLIISGRLREFMAYPNPWKQHPARPTERLSLGAIRRIQNGSLTLWSAPTIYPRVTDRRPLPSQDSCVPSLTELILRQLSNIDPRGETPFSDYMPSGSPQSVMDHLKFLEQHSDRRCASCKRTVILAGEEQLEWWGVSSGHSFDDTTMRTPMLPPGIPFRRVICSKACQPTTDSSMVDVVK